MSTSPQALTDDGYAVFALDHRGHGRSGGPRALIDSLDNAVADLDALVDDARLRHPGLPIFMLGHSMGGTIALRYAIEYQHRLDGLILSGPLAALEGAPAPLRLLGSVLSAIAPKTPLIGVDPKFVSRDPGRRRGLRRRPARPSPKAAGADAGRAGGDDRPAPRDRHRDHDPDADPLRLRGQAMPARGQPDARRPDRRTGQDDQGLPGPLPRDPQRARARRGAGGSAGVARRAPDGHLRAV